MAATRKDAVQFFTRRAVKTPSYNPLPSRKAAGMERYDIDELGCMSPRADGDYVLYDDAQRALDAEREKVKRLSTCGTDHSTPWWEVKCEDLEAQLAALQAQLRQVEEALDEALGALGYPVPADTPSPGRYKCGLCEAATLAAQDAGKAVPSGTRGPDQFRGITQLILHEWVKDRLAREGVK